MEHPLNENGTKRYKAFISYSHGNNQEEGRKWADWLLHALETYEIPEDLIGKKNAFGQDIPRQIYPVFQDEKELSASSSLNTSLTDALDRSEFLIYLSSPRSARSTYVRDEIRYFKKTGKSKQIIALILSGEPEYSGKDSELQCFPDELRFNIDGKGNILHNQPEEVLAADARIPHTPNEGYTSPEAYRHQLQREGKSNQEIKTAVDAYKKRLDLALLKIIAGILGVPLGELTKRDQAYQLEKIKQKNKNIKRIAIAISALAILAILAGIFAWTQKNAAFRNLARSLYASGINKLTESEYGDGAAYIAEATRRGDESAKLFAHSMLAVQDDLTTMPNSSYGSATYSPDGQWIAVFANVGASKNILQIWNALDRKLVKQLPDINTQMVFRPKFDDINRVYTTVSAHQIIRYDIKQDKAEILRPNPDSAFLSIKAVSPSGQYLIFTKNNQVTLFNTVNKQENILITSPELTPSSSYFSANNKTVVLTLFKDNTTEFKVYDLSNPTPKPVYTKILESGIRNPVFSKSAKQIAFINQQGLHYVDFELKKQWELPPTGIPYRFLGMNKNGTITAGNDNSLELYNSSGAKIKSTQLPKNLFFSNNFSKILAQDPTDMEYRSPDWTQEIVTSNPLTFIKNIKNDPLKIAQFYADDSFLAGIPGLTENDLFILPKKSNVINLLNMATGETQKDFIKINNPISFIHLLPLSKIFIVKDTKNITHAFDATTGKALGKPFASEVKQYIFNIDQTQVLARTGPNGFGIWDLKSGNQLVNYSTDKPLGGFVANPDFKTILAVGDQSWQIIDVQSKKVIKEEKNALSSGIYNKQGTALVIVESSGKARVLDTKQYKTLFEIPTIEFPFLVFNNKGNVLAISEDANHMRLWDLDKKKSFGQTIIISKYSKYFQFAADDSKIYVQDDNERFGFAAKLVDATNGNVLTMPFINKKFDFIHVLPGENKLLTIENLIEGKAISTWEIPGKVTSSNEQLAQDLEKFYGKKYDEETGAILAHTTTDKDYTTWYFQDPDVRSISPNSSESIMNIIRKHNPIKTDADLQFLAVTYSQHPLARAILADYFSSKPETQYIGQRMYAITKLQLARVQNQALKKEVENLLKSADQKLNQ